MKLPLIKSHVEHIDRCGVCCLASWAVLTGIKPNALYNVVEHPPGKMPKLIGYIPAPFNMDFCGLALVYECQECFMKYWTHYDWNPISRDKLSNEALECLDG